MNKFRGDRVLQTLLEDFFEAVNQVGGGLLAEVGMCPLADSEQLADFDVFVLREGFGFWAHRNGIDAKIPR